MALGPLMNRLGETIVTHLVIIINILLYLVLSTFCIVA